MNYYSEKDIRDIVASIVAQTAVSPAADSAQTVPVEISARHVHLTREAVDKLFGAGYKLTPKRDLSQPGQFLSEERVKIVTRKGELDNIAVLGPERQAVQVELSMTDARALGLKAPIRLSGDLTGAADVIIIGPMGMIEAKGSAIVARAHLHMTPQDAQRYGVNNGEKVSIRMDTERPMTINDVEVRVSSTSKLAVHIDFDEANAAALSGDGQGWLIKGR